MDGLDLVLVAVCLVFAVTGYRQGFVIGVLAFVGFLGGGALGAELGPQLRQHVTLGLDAALFGLLAVFVGASLGQLLATAVGVAVRRRISWRPARTADSLAGSAISVVSVLLVAWLVGTSLAHSAAAGVSRQVRRSVILAAVDRAVPADAQTWFSSFRRLLDRNGLPEVFGGIGADPVVPVAPPDRALTRSAVVRQAEPSVVKITGDAPSCSRRLEGSGFVIATDRVLTNAHVVAGVSRPVVHVDDGRVLDATVVLDDPERDVAVLAVPGLRRTPLRFSRPLPRGRGALVVGFPENGPFTAVAARVRGVQSARGPDIYQDRQVTRQIYSLYARVQPGNSGGPLLTTTGRVAGVVFAAALDDARTGYALTAAEVSSDAAAGTRATAPVSSGACD